jgi:sortase (surface protein transpeptidase)
MTFAVRAKHARFYSSAALLYGFTMAFAWYVLQPTWLFTHGGDVVLAKQVQPAPVQPATATVAGRPVRIVIPDSGVDLPVDVGAYDPQTKEWSLSGYHAQFATISSMANNLTGDTFIYGHNNNYVFGALRHHTPALKAPALIYTDNGHIFRYTFAQTYSVGPEDTSVLTYDGPPVLTIQTCTGSLNEWRTMFVFNFESVAQ